MCIIYVNVTRVDRITVPGEYDKAAIAVIMHSYRPDPCRCSGVPHVKVRTQPQNECSIGLWLRGVGVNILYNRLNCDVRFSIQVGDCPITFVDDITRIDGGLVLVTLSDLDEPTRLEGHVEVAVDKGGDVHVVPVLDFNPT